MQIDRMLLQIEHLILFSERLPLHVEHQIHLAVQAAKAGCHHLQDLDAILNGLSDLIRAGDLAEARELS